MSIFPTKILLATDGSEEATLAATTAAELAERTGSELHVIHVGPLARYAATRGGRAALSSAQNALDREVWRLLYAQVKQVETAGGHVAQAHLRSSERPDAHIVDLAKEIETGLIVIGSRGYGRLGRALMGSVSDNVVRHAHCPVLVVRKEEQ
jgi:nucleotide-binding universal stress UspA family protein